MWHDEKERDNFKSCKEETRCKEETINSYASQRKRISHQKQNLITKEDYEKNLDFIRSTLATTTAPLVLDVKKLRAVVNRASAEFMNKLT